MWLTELIIRMLHEAAIARYHHCLNQVAWACTEQEAQRGYVTQAGQAGELVIALGFEVDRLSTFRRMQDG